MPRKPDFFIIGAPKTATTTLWHYLSEHPDVFMPDVKEPHYFSNDLNISRVETIEEYESLFDKADDHCKLIGEASVYYLYSTNAVRNIEAYCPSARYIVSVRNPMDMVVSLHSEQLGYYENLSSFQDAWNAISARKKGNRVPALCPEPKLLFYDEICYIGKQLERLLKTVDRSRVKIVLFDDLRANPDKVYRELLDFLELRAHIPTSYSAHRQRKQWRSPAITRLLNQLGSLKRKLGIKKKTGLLKPLYSINLSRIQKSHISDELRRELCEVFRDDIRRLESIIGRDLSSWF